MYSYSSRGAREALSVDDDVKALSELSFYSDYANSKTSMCLRLIVKLSLFIR